MAGQAEPTRKSRLSRASTVYPDSAETLPRSSEGFYVKSSSAVCGIVACVAIALAVPHLYPHPSSHDDTLEFIPGNTNVTTEASACTAQRRDNATIEAALEAAVSGAFLADAASLGFQGLYDAERMMRLLSKDNDTVYPPEFHKALNLEYKAKKGSFSAYAYEALPLMHTLLGKNTIEAETFSADTVAFLDGYKGHISPVMQDFLASSKQGLSGDDAASSRGNANSLVKVPLIVARYGGDPALMGKVATAVQLHQSDADALLAAHLFAAILERLTVFGGSLQEAVAWVSTEETGLSGRAREWIEDVTSRGDLSAVDGAREIGIGPEAEQVLKSGLQVALKAEDYVSGVRQSIMAGGDTTSRAHVVGALLGALHGDEALPGAWQKKAKKYMEVKQMAHIVIVQRKTFVPFHINRDPAQQPEASK
ncbi:g1716 [Coccomyxa viridis]|uniref:G1716 protein n=1 Tax=Coccomyxa viridis TaxID=1274662 RepID=A0ABP1FNW2_9CHLO